MTAPTRRPIELSRRTLLGAALTLVALPTAIAAETLPPAVDAAIRAEIGDAVPQASGITLRLPDTAENGAFVPVTVSVTSAMTGADRCVAIHLFATQNPTPGIASFRFGPAIARAEATSRIRLAEGQTVLAYAVMADGSVRRAAARVAVTTGGCLT
jgi:sulfur-oxidizing protein SoxY